MSYQASQFKYLHRIDRVSKAPAVTRIHRPVMLTESIDGLAIQPEGCYLDATFGRGGHSQAILAKLGPQGQLLVLDRDPEALAQAQKLAAQDVRVRVLKGAFSQVGSLLANQGLSTTLDGALFDFGVSSPQLDDAKRGFSFQQDGPLDMRMDNAQGPSARDWLARASVEEMCYVFKSYGEESQAQNIAEKIVAHRASKAINTTKDLVAVILSALPSINHKRHPATKIFQAIRMHINDELQEIILGLRACIAYMHPGSRLVTLSYHSLEHTTISQVVKQRVCNDQQAIEPTPNLPKLKRVGRAQRAGRTEVMHNARSRSALLRVWEVLND